MTGTRIKARLKKLSKSILTSNVSLCACIIKISTNLSNFHPWDAHDRGWVVV